MRGLIERDFGGASLKTMIRSAMMICGALALAVTPAVARSKRVPDAETSDTEAPAKSRSRDSLSDKSKGGRGKGDQADTKTKDTKGGKNKPQQVGTFGDWGAFTASQGKGRTCYALAEPKDRAPASLKRDKAFVFISNRPGENVRNEVSIIMGFPMKDNSDAKAEIDRSTFDLICKGGNAWLKNAAKEGEFVDALRRGSKLVVKASSIKGGVSTDSYSLGGLSDALTRIQKDCP